MKRMININLVKIIVLICSITLMMSGCGSDESFDLKTEINDLAESVLEDTPEATIGSTNGEWAVIGLAESSMDVPDDYFDIYYDNVRAYVKSNQGILSKDMYTEYSRIIMALSAIGKDPRDVEGYDLTAPLNDFDKVIEQGINGPVYALISSNSSGIKLESEEYYIEYILDSEIDTGGFGFSNTFDSDITAMAVQALAPYKNRGEVDDVIERSIEAISREQNEDGTFDSGSETIAQVVLALNSLGRNPMTDEKFIKGGENICDVLISYKTKNGLAHMKGESADNMATEQGLYALASL